MSEYRPRPGVWAARPPCDACGANFHLHRAPAPALSPGEQRTSGEELAQAYARGIPLLCPEAYRPTGIEEAEQALRAAEASGSAERVFVARGNLQRLTGRLQSQG